MMWIFNIFFGAAIYLVYKVYKIRPRPWNISIFVTIFVMAVVSVSTLWTQASPYSTRAVVGRYVVPIVPSVHLHMFSIPANSNVPNLLPRMMVQLGQTPDAHPFPVGLSNPRVIVQLQHPLTSAHHHRN